MYTSLLLIITLPFNCSEMETFSPNKQSQNIMSMIACQTTLKVTKKLVVLDQKLHAD